MSSRNPTRFTKRVRHYDEPGHAHFLTFSCYKRMPLLSKDRTRLWLVDSINDARIKHEFDLWAWVFMPEHVHLLVLPRRRVYSTAKIIADIKRPVGKKAIAYLHENAPGFLERLTVVNKNRTYYRFWQAGPGQDHNVDSPATALRIIEYIHNNPIRRQLVQHAEDWEWSSAPAWLLSRPIPLMIDRTIPAL